MKIILKRNLILVLKFIFILFCISCKTEISESNELSIIPQVQKIEIKESYFELTKNTVFGVEVVVVVVV